MIDGGAAVSEDLTAMLFQIRKSISKNILDNILHHAVLVVFSHSFPRCTTRSSSGNTPLEYDCSLACWIARGESAHASHRAVSLDLKWNHFETWLFSTRLPDCFASHSYWNDKIQSCLYAHTVPMKHNVKSNVTIHVVRRKDRFSYPKELEQDFVDTLMCSLTRVRSASDVQFYVLIRVTSASECSFDFTWRTTCNHSK